MPFCALWYYYMLTLYPPKATYFFPGPDEDMYLLSADYCISTSKLNLFFAPSSLQIKEWEILSSQF